MNCKDCKFWTPQPSQQLALGMSSSDMGICSKLTGSESKEYAGNSDCPDVEVTGVEAYPICGHDGMAVDYETKSWFGCIHFTTQH